MVHEVAKDGGVVKLTGFSLPMETAKVSNLVNEQVLEFLFFIIVIGQQFPPMSTNMCGGLLGVVCFYFLEVMNSLATADISCFSSI